MKQPREGAPEPISSLNKVLIQENGEPLVNLRDECPDVRIKEEILPYVRASVARKLNTVQDQLPEGYHLYIFRALRTMEMQKLKWDTFHLELKQSHPNWPLSTLRRATNRYFAPYDQFAPPGHCTGGAVDVALINPLGEFVDYLPPLSDWSLAHTYSNKVGPEIRQYRMLLLNQMVSAGFSNCRDEHWHYSYGDSAWAVRTGQGICCYGAIDPPQ